MRMSDTETKAPTRKTPVEKTEAAKEPKKTAITVGCVVTYAPTGDKAVVTGVDLKRKKVYLDTPIVKWVAASDCTA